MHSRFAQDTENGFWFSAALQQQLTAPLCYYSHTCANLPFIQICNCPTLMHSRFAQGTEHGFWFSAALQKQLTAPMCHYSHTCAKFAFHTSLQLPNTDAQQVCPGHYACFLVQYCSAKPSDSTHVSLQSHLCKICLSYRSANCQSRRFSSNISLDGNTE